MRRQTTLLAGLAVSALMATAGSGAVINGIDWREVNDSNTDVASGSIETNGFDGGGGDQTDNNWDYATPHGVIGPGDVFDDTSGTGTGMMAKHFTENPGKLTVTLSGILDSSKSYYVYAAFRGASNQEGVEVSLDGNSNYIQQTFNGSDTNLDGTIDDAATTVLGTASNETDYYYVDSGIGTVTGTSDLSVYFREPTTTNAPGTPSAWQWSIIDAVGVQVVPEPASIALLGLGGVMLLPRRRR